MAKKKINLLFDATVLSLPYRCGIYNVAYEILKLLMQKDNINLKFYCSSDKLIDLKKKLKTELYDFHNIPIINDTFYERLHAYGLYFDFKESMARKKRRLFKLNIIKLKKTILNVLKKFCDLYHNKGYSFALTSIDIFFSPCYAVPESIKHFKKIKKFIVLYDVIPLACPEYKESDTSWFSLLCKDLNPDYHYFVISKFSKREFIKYFPKLKNADMHLFPLAASEIYKPDKRQDFRQALNINGKYVLTICNTEPRKNLEMMVKSFNSFVERNNVKDLVFVVGGCNQKLFKHMVFDDELMEHIQLIGYVEDRLMAQLYSNAEWFVYTSQYEGFGLPPLEAMACGCPVITSNNSSLLEVVGDAGILIDCMSCEEHVKAYEKYYFDKKFRNKMAQKGLDRAKQFSWENCLDLLNVKG